jgi:hypothetical protein
MVRCVISSTTCSRWSERAPNDVGDDSGLSSYFMIDQSVWIYRGFAVAVAGAVMVVVSRRLLLGVG